MRARCSQVVFPGFVIRILTACRTVVTSLANSQCVHRIAAPSICHTAVRALQWPVTCSSCALYVLPTRRVPLAHFLPWPSLRVATSSLRPGNGCYHQPRVLHVPPRVLLTPSSSLKMPKLRWHGSGPATCLLTLAPTRHAAACSLAHCCAVLAGHACALFLALLASQRAPAASLSPCGPSLAHILLTLCRARNSWIWSRPNGLLMPFAFYNWLDAAKPV